jgi:hypothetical protein
MNQVRAKFVCNSVSKSKHWDASGRFLYTASLSPVVSGSEENKQFFSSTPVGKIELGSFSEDHFEPGKEYYVDFSKAE